jgi:NAD(P)-dependent dehydrogenase (short-subunit alcohol dehydrogenase family)
MEDMFGLAGKVAIVWGGGQSMGEAYAMRLARVGCDVAVVDLVAERAETVAVKVRELGRRSVALSADARDPAAVEAAVDQAERELGPLYAMATVIGMAQHWTPVLEMSLEQWRDDNTLNLETFLLTAQACARRMVRNGGGAIVGTVSVSGLTSSPRHAAYGAAKAGIANLVRSMASELAPNIRVNAVAPGPVATLRITKDLGDGGAATFAVPKLPMQRSATVDEMAKAGLFLLSDLASYVTGHTLPVEGGWQAAYLVQRGDVTAS